MADYYDAALGQRVDLANPGSVPSACSLLRLLSVLQLPALCTEASGSPIYWRIGTPGEPHVAEGTAASISQATYRHARFLWHRFAHLRTAASYYWHASNDERGQMQAWMHLPADERAEHPWQLTFDALGIQALRDLTPLPRAWIAWYMRRMIMVSGTSDRDWTDELALHLAEAQAAMLAEACKSGSAPCHRTRL